MMLTRIDRWALRIVYTGVISFFCAAAYFGLAWGGSHLARAGEEPFTREQRDDIAELKPGAVFLSDSEIVYCSSDGMFHHVDSRQREWILSDRDNCAQWLRARR